ncbi:MAG TPA: PD-(D/E)XK nuclease family protein [Blastocatellia bacterium]|nr:PD-(D/E)XK nuclease family protein [Blastocatellia bacterium]
MRPIDRYPHSLLGISHIAEQAYCEQMVDLWLQNPGSLTSVPAIYEERLEEVPEARRQVDLAGGGTQFHESVSSAAAPASWDEIKEMLRSGHSLTMLESRLQGSYDSLALVGRPDAVCFDGWKARCILEYKVTESSRLYLNHRVQLLTYGYLLEQESFDVNDLILVCVFVPRRNKDWIGSLTERQAGKFLTTIRSEAEALLSKGISADLDWYHPGIRIRRGVEVKLRVIRYSRQEASRYLRLFADYWLGRRGPKPTTTKRKCQICLYNAAGLCATANAPYTG